MLEGAFAEVAGGQDAVGVQPPYPPGSAHVVQAVRFLDVGALPPFHNVLVTLLGGEFYAGFAPADDGFELFGAHHRA